MAVTCVFPSWRPANSHSITTGAGSPARSTTRTDRPWRTETEPKWNEPAPNRRPHSPPPPARLRPTRCRSVMRLHWDWSVVDFERRSSRRSGIPQPIDWLSSYERIADRCGAITGPTTSYLLLLRQRRARGSRYTPGTASGGFAADEVRLGLSMALDVPLLFIEAGRRNWTARMGSAVSRPGALAIADRFDEMAALLESVEGDVRRAQVVSDDELFVDETLVELDVWQHHAGDPHLAEGYLNTATGAYIDSSSLFVTAATEIRTLAQQLPDH